MPTFMLRRTSALIGLTVAFAAGTSNSPQAQTHTGLQTKEIGVKPLKSLFGYVDTRGKFQIQPHFYSGSDFVDGVAIVREKPSTTDGGEQLGIDPHGKVLFKAPGYADGAYTLPTLASEQRSHLSSVNLMNLAAPSDKQSEKPKHEVIDSAGHIFWPRTNKSPNRQLVNDWIQIATAAANKNSSLDAIRKFYKHAGEHGLVAPNADDMSEQQLRWVKGSVSQGLAHIALLDTNQRRRFACLTKDGAFEFLFDPAVIDVGDFHEGLAAVKMEVEPHYDDSGALRLTGVGFVDKSGETVIKPNYLPLNENSLEDTYFYSGVACLQKGPWRGMIDRSGHTVMPFVYPFMRPFQGGLAACVVMKDEAGKLVSVNDTSHGFQSKAAYTDACARSLQAQLKDFQSKEIVRFHFRLDIPTNETVFITHGSDPNIKKELTAAIKTMKRPVLGSRMDYVGPVDLAIKNGKVGVAFTRTDPMATQILTRIKLWRQQRLLNPNSNEWQSLEKKIKILSDQIGDDSLTVPGA